MLLLLRGLPQKTAQVEGYLCMIEGKVCVSQQTLILDLAPSLRMDRLFNQGTPNDQLPILLGQETAATAAAGVPR